jgi:hypothetical protein
MTLRALFEFWGDHPHFLVVYFSVLPLIAWLTGLLFWFSGSEGWIRLLYAALVYLACVPGVMSLAFSIYLFAFERSSVMDADLLLQVMPVLSMFVTLFVIRRRISFDAIPGFERISGLIISISAVLILMFLMDRLRLFVWVNLSVSNFLILFVLLILGVRWGMKRLFR